MALGRAEANTILPYHTGGECFAAASRAVELGDELDAHLVDLLVWRGIDRGIVALGKEDCLGALASLARGKEVRLFANVEDGVRHLGLPLQCTEEPALDVRGGDGVSHQLRELAETGLWRGLKDDLLLQPQGPEEANNVDVRG